MTEPPRPPNAREIEHDEPVLVTPVALRAALERFRPYMVDLEQHPDFGPDAALTIIAGSILSYIDDQHRVADWRIVPDAAPSSAARLQVIKGGAGAAERFVCPWCGASFGRRHIASDGEPSLEEHWRVSAECSTNRNVNNPTSDKLREPEPVE